eukprot:475920-Pelagomonas_calceolata.AAC.3
MHGCKLPKHYRGKQHEQQLNGSGLWVQNYGWYAELAGLEKPFSILIIRILYPEVKETKLKACYQRRGPHGPSEINAKHPSAFGTGLT